MATANSFISFIRFLLWSSLAVAASPFRAEAAKPTVYIFGDSTLDVGTNDFVQGCRARADMFFNGIDFPYSTPTGRFSNGLNTADQIVRLLGYKRSPPPYLYLVSHPSSFRQNILHGGNFASGGSGIFNSTGQFLSGNVVSLWDQIQQFSYVREVITNITGSDEATDNILAKSFFLISVGSNDIFEYVFSPFNRTAPPPDFIASLQSTYQSLLKNLYDLGARKFGILGVPPLGCCPFSRTYTADGSCHGEANNITEAFNNETETFLEEFGAEYKDIKYSFGRTFTMTYYIIEDPLAFGFKDVVSACCGNANYPCNQTATLCNDRREYLFWDRFHPTELASELAALTLFGGSENLVTPMNFSRLLDIYIE